MSRAWLSRFLALICLVGSVPSTANAERKLPLRDNWQLQSAAKITANGPAISMAGFAARDWHSTSVPSTVLAALVANGVYPDPYYGDNLKSIPGYRDGRWLVMP